MFHFLFLFVCNEAMQWNRGRNYNWYFIIKIRYMCIPGNYLYGAHVNRYLWESFGHRMLHLKNEIKSGFKNLSASSHHKMRKHIISVTPWTCQAPLSTEFSRQEYHSPWNLPNPWIEPRSPTSQADSLPSELPGKLKLIVFQSMLHEAAVLRHCLIGIT